MNPRSGRTEPLTLSLSHTERWALHHVLLQRIDRERTASDPSAVDPPPLAVFQAFETLDTGGTTFTRQQRVAVAETIAEYASRTDDGSIAPRRIQRLLDRFETAPDRSATRRRSA